MLARAMQPEIKPINRWDLVQDAFGARRLDPALTRSENRWMAEALLDAQPAGGWRRLAGPVLTQATALNRLAATRLGIRDADDSAVDAAALLQWTTDASAVASFLQLREAERAGLIDWLASSPSAGRGRRLRDGRPGQGSRRGSVRACDRGAVRGSTTGEIGVAGRRAGGAGPSGGALPRRPIAGSHLCCGRSAWPPSHWSSGGPTTGTRRRRPHLRAGRSHPRRTRRQPGRRPQPSRWHQSGEPQPGARSRA